MKQRYCIDLANYERFPSRTVHVGNIPLGGNYPIRLQSMTNTQTMDLKKTVEQTKRIFDAGADFVRITTPGEKEARFLADIKKALYKDGYKKPLIADVHFQPKAAEIAAEIVEKVRINPGNYVDPRASFKGESLSEVQYKEELERMHTRLLPLINICKQNGTAIRIGSNYGSLSDRIINRYGNNAEGMVEAAMEFYHIFIKEGFENLILSMKASNPGVMVHACRLLNSRMIENGIVLPQHLGVTEAGEGVEGRLRSAIGIGALLSDGIGDTIRVSLTEAPEEEIPVAKTIVEHFKHKTTGLKRIPIYIPKYDSYSKEKFPEFLTLPAVVADLRKIPSIDSCILKELNFVYDKNEETWKPGKQSPECLIVTKENAPNQPVKTQIFCDGQKGNQPLCQTVIIEAVNIKSNVQTKAISCFFDDFNSDEIAQMCQNNTPIFLLKTESDHPIGELRSFFNRLGKNSVLCPVILEISNIEAFNQLKTAIDYGAALVEKQIAGIMLKMTKGKIREQNEFAWSLLQAAGVRRSKVEFISCPGCGRTLFDLETTTKKIKAEFGHLGELKIAVMGCIVNGPGEMLDADYGYIGAGKGKISLYKGQQAVLKNIPENEAVQALKKLLKQNNDWKDA
jgi:(E)-4-hydroxy-3-methylbut-2-enyl-diphosphate synthase